MLLFLVSLFITISVEAFCAEVTKKYDDIRKIADELRAFRLKEGKELTTYYPRNSEFFPVGVPFMETNPGLIQTKIIHDTWSSLMNKVETDHLNATQAIDYLASLPFQIDIKNKILYIGNNQTGEHVITMTPKEIFLHVLPETKSMDIFQLFLENRSLLLRGKSNMPALVRNLDSPLDVFETIFYNIKEEIDSNNEVYKTKLLKQSAHLIMNSFYLLSLVFLFRNRRDLKEQFLSFGKRLMVEGVFSLHPAPVTAPRVVNKRVVEEVLAAPPVVEEVLPAPPVVNEQVVEEVLTAPVVRRSSRIAAKKGI